MFVTEFGGPYQISILRPISIAMLDLIYAGKFERQYLENGKGYKVNGFKAVRQLYLAIQAANICGLHCPYCVGEEPKIQPLTKTSKLSLIFCALTKNR